MSETYFRNIHKIIYFTSIIFFFNTSLAQNASSKDFNENIKLPNFTIFPKKTWIFSSSNEDDCIEIGNILIGVNEITTSFTCQILEIKKTIIR